MWDKYIIVNMPALMASPRRGYKSPFPEKFEDLETKLDIFAM
jgi:hypothetical protein